MPRRKRVQVGWYCNHEDEPYDARTHMSSHGKMKRGKWIETFPEPNTTKGLQFPNYYDPKKRPACPKAVPAYIYQEQS
jgi:hypothetical protein